MVPIESYSRENEVGREAGQEPVRPTISRPHAKPFSVVLLCQALVTGGAQRQLVQLAIGLHARGVPVHVLTFYDGGELVAELTKEGVPHLSLGKTGRWDIVGFGWRLLQTLRRLRPSVVYGYMAVADILLVTLKPLLPGVAVVWGVRASNMNMTRYDRLTALAHKLESMLSSHADLIIANSESGRSYVLSQGFPERRLLVIPNGIDTTRFTFDAEGRARVRREWDVGDDDVLVGLPARLDPMKDHPTFLRSAAIIKRSNALIRFVCIGPGLPQYTDGLKLMAEELGLSSTLIWAGERSDMPAVYSALDIVVSASSFGEGFSNAIGEAMACGRPCVVTNVGDSARIVDRCGLTVKAGHPEELAEAILQLAQSDRSRLSEAARNRAVLEFSVSSMVTRTLDALAEASK